MDPITIIATVVAVAQGLGTIAQLIDDHLEKRDQRKEANGLHPSQAALQLSQDVNDLSSRLGRTLPDQIDQQLLSDLKGLQVKVQTMLRTLNDVKRVSSADNVDLPPTQKEKLRLQKTRAMTLKTQVQEAIDSFRVRLAKVNQDTGGDANSSLDLNDTSNNRRFCYGAILCQNNRANAASLATVTEERTGTPQWGFVCKYCSLEVGDYMAIRLKADGTPLETPDLLAASHLLACDLRHLRAFYRCLACHLKQKKTDFATAVELERHMDEHEGFPFLPKLLQSAGEKAAKKDIQDFLSREAPTYSREETQVAEVEFDLERPPPTSSPQPHPNRPPPMPPSMLPMGDVGA